MKISTQPINRDAEDIIVYDGDELIFTDASGEENNIRINANGTLTNTATLLPACFGWKVQSLPDGGFPLSWILGIYLRAIMHEHNLAPKSTARPEEKNDKLDTSKVAVRPKVCYTSSGAIK